MNHSPAEILHALLTDGSDALFGPEWAAYVGSMPDSGRGDVMTVYDTEGVVITRLLASGKHLLKFGVQIKTRSADTNKAFVKLMEVADALGKIRRQEIVISSDSYTIDSILLASPVLSLGQDEERRALAALNVFVFIAGY